MKLEEVVNSGQGEVGRLVYSTREKLCVLDSVTISFEKQVVTAAREQLHSGNDSASFWLWSPAAVGSGEEGLEEPGAPEIRCVF